jgi:hypothetical protein
MIHASADSLEQFRKEPYTLVKVGVSRVTYATRLSAGGVAGEWVTQLLRQGDAQVFMKYSQMKLQMTREALGQLNRRAKEMQDSIGTLAVN